MASLTFSLSLLAERLELDHIATVVLPTTIGICASGAGISDEEMIRACWDTPEIAEYVARVCNSPKSRAEVEAMLAEKKAA